MPHRLLSSLLITSAIIGAGVFLWLRLVAPNVAGVRLDEGRVVVHLTDEYAQRRHSRIPEAESDGAARGGAPLVYNARLSFPLYVPAVLALLLVFLAAAADRGLGRLRSRGERDR